ncbi:MAG: 23S rRNA (adenine(2503)-C(2))-methyltransferase RlmN [Tannerella sp.]|jgi:23S rRNA (adenine2503-C2)-methyltransferase|nr:23S rRNA (adenine(2503)-C(2))-methyltransferase RlmN [Tannerella sp.]
MEIKEPLLGMTLTELKAVVSQTSLPSYAAAQIADWLYKKKVRSIDGMTNISAANREALSEQYEVGLKPPVEAHTSKDDTTKYLFTVNHGRHSVEAVHIPSFERDTLCVSSQAGCKMNCLFCMTGKQGFAANLTSNEIMNQIQAVPENEQLSNIVFMGMGEPLDNIEALLKTLEILTAPYGYAWSPKRITVSTSGILPGLKRFLDESACHLAVSLHSPHHEERLSLMPVEKAYHIDSIIDLLHQYDFTHQRRVSFEYIMFHSLNDSDRHAKDLARLLNGIECRVNLIRFHAIPDVKLTSSSDRRIEQFRDTLSSAGVTTTIRASRGEDIFAACGMLFGN